MVTLKSLRDLHKLSIGPVVQLQRAGGHFKARFAGKADYTFGISPQEAKERLLSGNLCRPKRKFVINKGE